MFRSSIYLSLCVLACFKEVRGYGQYRDQLPNGHQVPHPCKPNFIWRGVGHSGTRGGGPRNQFGLDFAAEGRKWTTKLCGMDSDGDGVTNGAELGDPNCQWSVGQDPNRKTDITHPGVCTPFDSSRCAGKNDWVDCKGAVLECPAINDTDTQSLILKFPRTKVPAKETTYKCMVFDVPHDRDYHLIAHKPNIDNDNVMHHIMIYGCEETTEAYPTGPYDCDMSAASTCFNVIGAWSLGEPGDCMDEKSGLLFGKTKYKKFALEYHWNNPMNVANWYDETSVTIYYTSKLRPNNAAVLTVGQLFLDIPPGRPSVTFTATCSSSCTRRAMNGSIFLTGASNHMHYLGISQKVELIRDDTRLRYITNDTDYKYDDPKFYLFDPPIEVQPGDFIRSTCEYKTTTKTKWTNYGDATSDEMCYAFVWFYPAENMLQPYCENYKNLEICASPTEPLVVRECNVYDFVFVMSAASLAVYEDVGYSCYEEQVCTPACGSAVAKARKHPCLRGGDLTNYIKILMNANKYGQEFLKALALCENTSSGTACSGRFGTVFVVIAVLLKLIY